MRSSFGALAARGRGGDAHRLDDVLVAGAAAEIAGDRGADLVLVGVGVLGQEGHQREQEARGAEAALQRVRFAKGLLQRVERAVGGGQPFDRGDLATVHLHAEQQTRAHRLAVDEHRAGAAHSVLAADVGAGQPELVPQQVREQQPRLDAQPVHRAVDADLDVVEVVVGHARATRMVDSRVGGAPCRARRPGPRKRPGPG